MISYSWPLIFFGVITGLLPNVDSFVVGYIKGASDVGIYNTALLISGLLTFIPTLFYRLFFPLITREFSKKNLNIIKELSKQIQKWIFIVNLPFLILMIFFPGVFINLLFGAQYITAEAPLRFLAVAFFLVSLIMILSGLISMVGKSKLILLNTLIFSVTNLILNVLLVPKYGISGAAFSTMISYAILALIFFFQVKHYTNIIPLRRKMLSIIFSIIPPTIMLFYIRKLIPVNLVTIILEGSLFILLYILFIFITKSLDKNDFKINKK
jgi:O-antigen/teichoic acid export membrane protein